MDLSISSLHAAYRSGEATPETVFSDLVRRVEICDPRIWISLIPEALLERYLQQLEGESPDTLPLFGIPFAIKDNIDLAEIPTTAACPDYAYIPDKSAFVVERLIDAGAIPIGKTNLDQFATGLVGVRSPYGIPENPFNPDYIPGGSSSGSAVAVARDLVTFSLGTDTAGSGRVPASFNELVGVKPSFGLLSCTGVVPACKSLDCVSIFAKNSDDACSVLDVAKGFDPSDSYSRLPSQSHWFSSRSFTFGVPEAEQLQFFGDEEARELFWKAIDRLERMGGRKIVIDFSPFLEAALLLYEGPWVAERFSVIEEFLDEKPNSVYPVTRKIIEGGGKPKAVEAFRASYRLKELKRRADCALSGLDFIVTPTAGTVYKISEVEADPVQLNSNLGYYTNFMNLLDCCAVAVPAGRLDSRKLPWGVTFFSHSFTDEALLALAHRFLDPDLNVSEKLPEDWCELVVCGAHMKGLPLNHQLTDRGARFLKATATADCYRLHALQALGNLPPRPGLVRTQPGMGAAIAVEVWAIPQSQLGSFVNNIPAPLGFGKVILEDGHSVTGFLCEEVETSEAEDISELGGWRAFLER